MQMHTHRSGRVSTLNASEADISLSKRASAPAADQQVLFLLHLDFGQTHAQPPTGIHSPAEKQFTGRAAAVLSATPGERCAYMHQAAILQQQQKQQKLSRGTQKKGGKSRNTPKYHKFRNFS
jgi:hypothetical protein